MLNKILFFRKRGGANFILTAALVCSVMMISSHELRGQCAYIYDQAFPGSYSCGCWTTNIRITDLPTNRIGKLSMTVLVNNAQDLVWNNSLISNSFHSFFHSGGTFTYTFQSDRILIEYENFDNQVTISNTDILFSIAFCNKPGESVTVQLFSTGTNPFMYLDNFGPNSCTPTYSGLTVRQFPKNSISGIVERPSGTLPCDNATNNGLPNVSVNMADLCNNYTPAIQYITTTNNSGQYSIDGMNTGGYKIKMTKDIYPKCGLTTYDTDLMRQWILGQSQPTYPWQLIAGDVNFSGSITTTDIVLVGRVINDYPAEFPSWRILPGDQYNLVTQQHLNNFQLPALDDFKDYSPLNNNHSNQDWIGIKLGDVSGNCTDCEGDYQFHEGNTFGYAYSEQTLINQGVPVQFYGDYYDIPLLLDRHHIIGSMHLAFEKNPDIEIIDIWTDCELMFGLYPLIYDQSDRTNISIFWGHDNCAIQSEEAKIYVRVRKRADVNGGLILISEDRVSHAYDEQSTRINFGRGVDHAQDHINSLESFSVKVFPNPASEQMQIQFDNWLEDESYAEIRILNSIGQEVLIDRILPTPSYRVDVNKWIPGLYHIVIKQGDNYRYNKLIISK